MPLTIRKKHMTTEELRRIPIDKLLSHLGLEPVSRSRGGTQLLYRSPFREDRKPSFSVSLTRNIWNDYGIGKGGDVIALAEMLNGNCTFHAAAIWLEKQYSQFGGGADLSYHPTYLNPRRPSESDIRNVRVQPLEHKALLSYLMSRGIPMDIGTRYCQEVHYSVFNKEYYGICFPNILGGMEIRNVYFKGCHGTKAPSIVPVDKIRRTETCCVFEGFMDFLSYIVLCRKKDPLTEGVGLPDCIVLNSVSMVKKAAPFLDVYQMVFCYLDNDEAGSSAFSEIRDALGAKVESKSHLFLPNGDLNDYLKNRSP